MMISQVLRRKIMNFMEAKFLNFFFGGGWGGWDGYVSSKVYCQLLKSLN